MFNIKANNFYTSNKEQKYLRKLIDKTNDKTLKQIYKDFEIIVSYTQLEEFKEKYKKFFHHIKLDKNLPLNELKEKVAFEIVELILKKINS